VLKSESTESIVVGVIIRKNWLPRCRKSSFSIDGSEILRVK